jgi:hypothetical protein
MSMSILSARSRGYQQHFNPFHRASAALNMEFCTQKSSQQRAKSSGIFMSKENSRVNEQDNNKEPSERVGKQRGKWKSGERKERGNFNVRVNFYAS